MKAAAKEVYGTDSLGGKTIAIQGVGNVAFNLCRHLHEEGAKLIVTDINQEALQRAEEAFGALIVAPEDIYSVEADIFAPCALGATLNDETIPQLKVKIIAGAANNQLKEDRHGDMLEERDILYVPDFVINAGGVINVADELDGYNRDRAMKKSNSSTMRSRKYSKSQNAIIYRHIVLLRKWQKSVSQRCVVPAANSYVVIKTF